MALLRNKKKLLSKVNISGFRMSRKRFVGEPHNFIKIVRLFDNKSKAKANS